MQSKLIPFLKKYLIVLFPVLIFSGCGIWNNFTTYFNLYYDTVDIFSQAEADIKAKNDYVFDTENLDVPPETSKSLQKVIEKCSNILQFHSTSNYVDNALLILGKSFYYQGNYQKSERELRDLITTRPNSDLVLETKLWIGKDQMKLKQYDTALVTLNTVIKEAKEQKKNDILTDAYIERIKYRIVEKDNSGAIAMLNEFLGISKNDKLKAQAAYEAGELYKDQQNYKEAIKSFQRVDDYSPSYLLSQNAHLELGRTYRMDDQYQKALNIFETMRSEHKYSEVFDVIDVETGITLSRMEKYDEALKQLVYVDTAYARSKSAGLASYEIAKLYQKHYRNLDSAYNYYNKCLAIEFDKDDIADARNTSEMIRQFQTYFNSLGDVRKQVEYLEHPEIFVKDSIDYFDKLEAARQKAEDSLSLYEEKNNMNFRKNVEERDSLLEKIQTVQDTAVKDSLQKLLTETENALKGIPMKFNVSLKIPEPKRPDKPLDTLKEEIARDEFSVGNLLFTEFNMTDSAYSYYMNILDNYPDTKLKANVLFAVGSYYLVKNDTVKADSIFNIIYDKYKNEPIVNAAADKLNKPLINFNYDPAAHLYADAEKLLDDKKYDTSIVKMYNIYKTHPKSPYAAKALYATGWILSNKLNLLDSAATVYDTLSNRYPESVYTHAVSNELIAYREEKKLEKQNLLDSLNHKPGIIADSTKKINPNAVNEVAEKNKNTNTPAQQGPIVPPVNAVVTNPDTLIRIRPRLEP